MKKLSAFLPACALALLLTACGSTSGNVSASVTSSAVSTADSSVSTTEDILTPAMPEDGLQVGIVLPTMAEPRWLQDQKQFEKLLVDAGFSAEVMFSDGDAEKESANVSYLVRRGASVIILCAHDGAAVGDVLDEAKKEGVTIIAYDRLITGTDAVDYYVTFESLSVGEAQAQYLVDHAPEGRGIPLYLYAGASTDNNAFLFFEGAWRVLQPKIADGTYVIQNCGKAAELQKKATLTREELEVILEQISTNWDFDTASKLAADNLASGGEKGDVLILAPNDGTARAIADAFAEDHDVTSYVISGQDAEIASVQYIIDGKQSMTVFKDTRTLAKDAVDMAVTLLNGKTPDTGAVTFNGVMDVPSKQTAVVSVDAENVKSVLIDSGYYDESEFTGLR